MVETFGPEYLRPAQKDCARCGCCSADLCAKGRNSLLRCQGHTSAETRGTVADCPCSAESTRHTAAWRAAQVRVTRMAKELPVTATAEALLRSLTGRQVPHEPGEAFPELKLRGLVQLVHGMPAITPLGRTYLAARDDDRAPAAVRVVDVDKQARTARVEVPDWRPGETVIVLVDQIVSDCGLSIDALAGQSLEADANVQAEDADLLVLTGFRPAAPQPPRWVPAGGEQK
jgi:hypothetical protein